MPCCPMGQRIRVLDNHHFDGQNIPPCRMGTTLLFDRIRCPDNLAQMRDAGHGDLGHAGRQTRRTLGEWA